MNFDELVTYTSEASEYDSAEAGYISCQIPSRNLQWLLLADMIASMSTESKEEQHNRRRYDPRLSSVDMNEVVSDEAGNQRADTDDYDANDQRKCYWVARREHLTTDSEDHASHGETKHAEW